MNLKVFLLLLVCALAACDANSETLPQTVQLGADAISARQQADAANARALQVAAHATAVRQATLDKMSLDQAAAQAKQTDTAAQYNYAATRAANELLAAQEERKSAAQRATMQADAEAARGRAASATQEAETRAAETSEVRAAVRAVTAEARAQQTATATAYVPTAQYIAEQDRAAQAERERQRHLKLEEEKFKAALAPWLGALWFLLPVVTTALVVALLLYGFWRILLAAENWFVARTYITQADAFKAQAALLKDSIVYDRYQNPIGYFIPSADNKPPQFKMLDGVLAEPPVDPVLPSRGNFLNPPPALPEQPIAPPDRDVLDGFIHAASLAAFTEKILATGDWTQATWGDVKLPRGFILTKDTKDAKGNKVPGNYARVMALFVDRHLIINRRRGSAGEWNPNAPRDTQAVMAILFGEKPKPFLPYAPKSAPSPTEPMPLATPI